MKSRFLALGVLAALALAAAPLREARACGGCFAPVDGDTQVSQHRMILSASMSGTTLWDQIQYTGDPESFAWVLPVQGEVEVGLSSDLLFETLSATTSVYVSPPPSSCAPPRCTLPVTPRSTGGEGTPADDVVVLAEAVVGPYEMVQLSAAEPGALLDWLHGHGYAVPDDLQPVLAEYVENGSGFLALKLVPGEGIRAMRPVRVTSKGASLTLPLRMIAAGTGAVTPVTLFVAGEGRYEAANFANFEMSGADLTWFWDEQRSDYAAARSAQHAARGGKAWLTQWARPLSDVSGVQTLSGWFLGVVENSPADSGYEGDPAAGVSPRDEAEADLAKLFGGLVPQNIWLTRLHAELPRAALVQDLELGAAASQAPVEAFLTAQRAVGEPSCPNVVCSGDCAVEAPLGSTPPGTLLALAGLSALTIVLRRRREARRTSRSEPGRFP